MRRDRRHHRRDRRFQCSSASRKFLNRPRRARLRSALHGFSALQRAENSSILSLVERRTVAQRVSVLFSEPKIPQLNVDGSVLTLEDGFSALQRAENSSIFRLKPHFGVVRAAFQCSSASRKFLNRAALQRIW